MPNTWYARVPRSSSRDRDLTAERLAAELKVLCEGRGKLLAMAERARLVAKPRAAEELAAACLEQLEAA